MVCPVYSDEWPATAQRILRRRLAVGLGLEELAERIGIPATTLREYELGTRIPPSSHLIALSRALGVKVEYFFRPEKVWDL